MTTHGTYVHFEIENNLNRDILKAVPPGKLDYRPHERSPSTGQIAWTIVRGLYVRVDVVSQCFSHVIGDPDSAMAEILRRFEDTTRRHIAPLDLLPARQWTGSASYPPAIVLPWGARPVTSSGFPLRRDPSSWSGLHVLAAHGREGPIDSPRVWRLRASQKGYEQLAEQAASERVLGGAPGHFA